MCRNNVKIKNVGSLTRGSQKLSGNNVVDLSHVSGDAYAIHLPKM